LDSRLETSSEHKLFKGKARTVVFTSFDAPKTREKALERKGAFVFRVPGRKKVLSLKAILKVLHSLQVRSLLVEGGGEVHASFLREKLVDEVVLFIAPKLLGEKALGWTGMDGIENLARFPYLKRSRLEWAGMDLMLTGKRKS
jgi:diaminohydroxyphosphoribosylaminopyrimidine deaminase/5-amino-6-(5-phosphoribosylamino)uracil reductase